jgi:DnaJ-class molecular chaperone
MARCRRCKGAGSIELPSRKAERAAVCCLDCHGTGCARPRRCAQCRGAGYFLLRHGVTDCVWCRSRGYVAEGAAGGER